MKIKEMIEKLRFKAENIKAHIEPEFFNDVADELEKQIAKKLVVWDNGTQHCPYCEHDLTYISSEDEFCCRCGQKLDWNEVE